MSRHICCFWGHRREPGVGSRGVPLSRGAALMAAGLQCHCGRQSPSRVASRLEDVRAHVHRLRVATIAAPKASIPSVGRCVAQAIRAPMIPAAASSSMRTAIAMRLRLEPGASEAGAGRALPEVARPARRSGGAGRRPVGRESPVHPPEQQRPVEGAGQATRRVTSSEPPSWSPWHASRTLRVASSRPLSVGETSRAVIYQLRKEQTNLDGRSADARGNDPSFAQNVE